MSKKDVEHLEFELNKVVHRFRMEYQLSLAELLGTLEVIKHLVLKEFLEEQE